MTIWFNSGLSTDACFIIVLHIGGLYSKSCCYFMMKESQPPSSTATPFPSGTDRTAWSLPQCVVSPFLSVGNFNHMVAYCELFHSRTLTVASFIWITELVLTQPSRGLRKILDLPDEHSYGFLPFCTHFRLLQRPQIGGMNKFPARCMSSVGQSQNSWIALVEPFPGSSWLFLASVVGVLAFGACKPVFPPERLH